MTAASIICTAQLCCKVVEVIGASKNLRSEMKSLVQSAYSNKAEAHEKITAAVAKSVEGVRAHQVKLVVVVVVEIAVVIKK